ncbi:MAG: hypothetical protein PHW83_07590 [Bacteroidales bacterium]|nr:hypothetical protein [Bacteroidales bacterium]
MKHKNIKILIFIFVLFLQTSLWGQNNQIQHSIVFNNGISSLNISGKPSENFQNYMPFFTNQIAYKLNKEINNNYSIQIGIKPSVLRYIYEDRLFVHSLAFRSNYFICFPVSVQKRLAQKDNYWAVNGGLSLDLFIGRHDNYFHYEFSGYVINEDGDMVYTEELLKGKDAKIYNNTTINQQNPISFSCQASLIKHNKLNSGSAIEYGLNIQFMEILSFYNDNLFFYDNAMLLNFNFAVSYIFGNKNTQSNDK